MKPIATYLFFDLETTGLVEHNNGAVHITELGMLAVKREHLLDMEHHEEPRVQYKIGMCFNPQKTINKESAKISGLNNRVLKNEAEFNQDTFEMINAFINSLEKPVCLVAHNAFEFHFPILKYHFKQLHVELSEDILCTDSLYAFYDILEAENNGYSYEELEFDGEFENKVIKFETKTFSELRRGRFFFGLYPTESYKLKDIYMRVADGPFLQTNRAENQCIMIMKTVITRVQQFVDWVDTNNCPFSEVPIMNM